VLVVDDSMVVRRLVTEVLEAEPDIVVVGTARDGEVALGLVDSLAPDVITLDVEMPVRDGLSTVAELRRRRTRTPVIMLSTLTSRGASATIDALTRGATDYVCKPSGGHGIDESRRHLRAELVPKVRAYARPRSGLIVTLGAATPARIVPAAGAVVTTRRPRAVASAGAPAAPVAVARAARRAGPVTAVVVGVSTGGPNALAEVIPALPARLGVPVLIVQHMPPTFTGLLAQRLDSRSALSVREGVDGTPVELGTAWIAPGGRHMVARRSGASVVVGLHDGPPEHSCRPAVDVLFRSAATVWGPGVLAVVLTGMGRDGADGAAAIRAAGGQVIVQDEASSVVWGMPGAVVADGQADRVLPLGSIASEISSRLMAATVGARHAHNG
jgi:two-component system chemotaxis response regulator CheB